MRRTHVGRMVAVATTTVLLSGCAWVAQVDVPRDGSPAGSVANALTERFWPSSSGRYVFFDSNATNLVSGTTGDPTGTSGGIYRRDQLNSETVLLRPGARLSAQPSLSQDLRRILILENGYRVWDRDAGTTEPVVVAPGGGAPEGTTMEVTLSSGGRYVAFRQARANDVATYVRDVDTDQTRLVATVPKGTDNVYQSWFPDALTLNPDGTVLTQSTCRKSVFSRSSATCTDWSFERVSVTSATTSAPLPNQARAFSARPDAAGRFIAYERGQTIATTEVWLLDNQAGTSSLVSVGHTGAPQPGNHPSISANGRYIAFESEGPAVVPGVGTPRNARSYVRDRVLGITTLTSAAQDGTPANGFVVFSQITADGRYVTFRHFGSGLTPAATTQGWRIYTKSALIPRITDVSPDSKGRAQPVTVTITGSGFTPDADVIVGRQGHVIFHTALQITETTITFDLQTDFGTPLGAYDVSVAIHGTGPGHDGGAAANCAGCFTVTAT